MGDIIDILDGFGVPKSESGRYQILCLPENICHAKKKEELRDAGDSSSLSKELKALGAECGNSLDLRLNSRTYIRKSLDLWLGVIYIAQYVALPFLISAFANLVTNKALDSNSKVFLNLKINNGKNTTDINYEGDAETLQKILDALRK
jgi:hypothetical protein